MKALTLYVLLGRTEFMRLFSASGVSLFLCELFLHLFWCLNIYPPVSPGCRRHASKQRPVAWSISGLVPQGLFHSCDQVVEETERKSFFLFTVWGYTWAVYKILGRKANWNMKVRKCDVWMAFPEGVPVFSCRHVRQLSRVLYNHIIVFTSAMKEFLSVTGVLMSFAQQSTCLLSFRH